MTDLFNRGDKISQIFDITIVDKIAEGGMGEVYEAILHGANGFEKRIALKVVRSEFIRGKDQTETAARELDFITRLVNEAKLVSNLIHTHIVQIYLLGTIANLESKASSFIAMEYVNGVNVRSFIDRHIFNNSVIPVEIAVYIASRVARALEYAHSFKDKDKIPLYIVHRDVSPTNVLLSFEGVVKLSDFGIAKAVHSDLFYSDYIVGKRRYMAPEQLQTGDVDFRADIYSLGVLLYEMLYQELPDRKMHPVKPAAKREGVSELVNSIVNKSLEPDLSKRYKSTSELAVDLEKAIYSKGYGPTFVTLSEYLKEVFPVEENYSISHGKDDKTAFYRQ